MSNCDRVHCILSPPFGALFSGVTHHQGFTLSIFLKIKTVKPNPQTIGNLRVKGCDLASSLSNGCFGFRCVLNAYYFFFSGSDFGSGNVRMNSRRMSVIVLPVRSLSACMRLYSTSGSLKVILFCSVAIVVHLVYIQYVENV